ATIALQEQLARKDLLTLKELNYIDFSFGILKGKNNYLCPKRLNEQGLINMTRDKRFVKWAENTETGDKDDAPFVPDFWQDISGDSNDCASNECPFYEKCFYYKAYRRLYSADIIVANHYMLVYDFLAGSSLIPHHDILVVDEAHHIDDIISKVAGVTLTYNRVKWLLNRLKGLKIEVNQLYTDIETFFKVDLKMFKNDSNTISPIPDYLIERLKKLKSTLSFHNLKGMLEEKYDVSDNIEEKDRITTTIKNCLTLENDINIFTNDAKSDLVFYVQRNNNLIEFNCRLIDTQALFNNLIGCYKSVIMTSATLTTARSFSFFKDRLGLNDFEELILDSPFDYKGQSAIYIAKNLPPPKKEDDFLEGTVSIIENLINASKGRALVLFTSYRHLNYVAQRIDISYPLALQGDMPNAKLLKWFTETPESVLLATQSFWQGVDVKGDKLSLLIIAKIPFTSPGDPVYEARCKRLENRWFYELALPSAILNIRQGFGRLIRSASDRGVVAILDSRIESSNYGQDIISSLPQMNRLESIEEVEAFFRHS
ncbi:MAG: ATP-dependent DNA helicase, partial [Thermodesulfovibrionales bacterium]|nr:ATP-dependent DNA helicase [Thermodesulfovibrionales bacterium]